VVNERLAKLSPEEEGIVIGRTAIIRAILEEAGMDIGSAPYSPDDLDGAWAHVVTYPVEEEALDWVIGSFAGLLIEHFRARFGFKLRELTDQDGVSTCLVETRTNVRLFPFDMIHRRIIEQRQRPFGELFAQVDGLMAQQGLSPHRLSTREGVADG
jgi:hypothetical protein